MTNAAADLAPTDPPGDAEAVERARMAQRRAMLAELAEIGMGLARAIGRQALAATGAGDAASASEPGPEPAGPAAADLAMSFSRVARAVRQTLALEARLAALASKPAVAAEGGGPGEVARAALDRSSSARVWVNQSLIHDVVEQMIEDEAGDDEAAERLFDDLLEKLRDADLDIGEQAIGVTLARVCADLGLNPDWSRWAGEAWAVEEARDRVRGSPFGRPARGARAAAGDGGEAFGGEAGAGKTGPPWH